MMSHPVPTQGLAGRRQEALQNRALMGLFGDSKSWTKTEIEVSQAGYKPGQMFLSLLLCSEVGVLHCLRQGKRLGKPLLVPGWKEQLLTLLLGHAEEAQGFGGAYNSTQVHTARFSFCFTHQACQQQLPCLLLLLHPRSD